MGYILSDQIKMAMVIPWVLYLAGGYSIMNHVRAKKTILKVTISCPNVEDAYEIGKHIESNMMGHLTSHLIGSLEITTSPFGDYGICGYHADKKMAGNQVELYISMEYRGSLQWSLLPFISMFQDGKRQISSTLLKKE